MEEEEEGDEEEDVGYNRGLENINKSFSSGAVISIFQFFRSIFYPKAKMNTEFFFTEKLNFSPLEYIC